MKYSKLFYLWIACLSILVITACSGNKKESAKNKLDSAKEIRIAFQKSGALIQMKESGLLEKELLKRGIKLKWLEFSSGPAIMEALNGGSIDFCTTGAIPPIFAQVAGIDFVYIAHEPESPFSASILVPKGSPIKSILDLKGKKVGLVKGSTGHYVLVKALEKAGLTYKEIVPVYLQPSDASAAFERGSIDAWSIWEPYVSSAELQHGAKILSSGILPNLEFYLSTRKFSEDNPGLIKLIVKEIQRSDKEMKENTGEFAKNISDITGLPYAVSLRAVKRRNYGTVFMDKTSIISQEKAVETFYKLKLIDKRVNVRDAVWYPHK